MNVKELVNRVFRDWSRDIDGKIREMLDERLHDTIAKLLGFDDSYGRWEIDHCNGRNSPITRYLDEKVRDAVRCWLEEHFCDLPEPSDEWYEALRNDYLGAYKSHLRRRASLLAERAARDRLDLLLRDAIDEVDFNFQ